MTLFSMVSVMIVIVSTVLILLIFSLSGALPRIASTVRAETTITDGYPGVAQIIDISQMGVMLNNVPLMRMVVRINDNGILRVVTIQQYVDLGNMPRAGERVKVVIDRADPKRVRYVGVMFDAY
ncbi:hypothetical protein [Burkholderia seminalis]|uniref:hypothetical protein n=1 Tax=Burkholderia seminalis TaxID=488731 RepID=UPI0014546461|nr:hypothetical protein [Burkholderia seminalis]MCA8435387.1 hypothetical protein [Burkholderia seminalis]VWC32989.1 hypothetical protein BSE24067_06515 [Burkholderia seminalis]